MSAPKNKIKNVLEKGFQMLEKQRYRFMKKKQEMNDRFENREYLGSDKFENQYFQYYSYQGLPTRRRVYYKFFSTNKYHIDVHFLDWLHHRVAFPPDKQELEQLYIEDEDRKQKSLRWDKEEEKKQIAYRNKLQQIGKDPEQLLLETSEEQNQRDEVTIETFKPVPWKAVAKTKDELRRYVPPEEIREQFLAIEEGIIEEHKNYQDYLKSKGKDKDRIAEAKMLKQVHELRFNYEHMQKYAYLANEGDMNNSQHT